MENRAIHVMTIANSIIGVSILAMPYCFKQCGIILSMVILIVSSIISRLSCHLLLKSAIMARRRTFEFLAFHAFGPLGKFIIEIGLIGFLLGTCIAFFVVMGDLGPAIVVKMTGTKATDTLRTSILMALALFCVLPLGLLRNIDSLTSVCTATIGFYFCLVLKIIVQSAHHISSGDWIDKVELWRPAGFLQCLPIFSMALFCQTQIFEIYQAIPNASLEKMNELIRLAVNICTGVYIFVGIFGYIAFCGQTFTGNILMSFPTSLISEAIKIGFVLSVAFSFPLIIFPCRASLYSLLYKRTYSLHEGADKYIPEGRFKGLTFMIVCVSLLIGVMIPNIELVLGLVGSTIGIMICVLFPAMCFICISTKNTNERILAQLMLFVGIIVMVLGTYANLYAMEEITTYPITEKAVIPEPEILKIVEKDPILKDIDIPNPTKAPENWVPDKKEEELQNKEMVKEVRHEPPQPEEPAEAPVAVQVKDPPKPQVEAKKPDTEEVNKVNKGESSMNKPKDSNVQTSVEQQEENAADKKDVESPVLQQPLNVDTKESNQQQVMAKNAEVVEVPIVSKLGGSIDTGKVVPETVNDVPVVLPQNVEVKPPEAGGSDKGLDNKVKELEIENKINGKRVEEVAKEAIEKEEKELLEQEQKIKEEEKRNMDLIKSLEERNKEQKKLVEEKKKLLAEIKQRQEALEQEQQQNEIDKVKEEKLKAVEQIKQIAEQAIEKLSGADKTKVEKPLDNDAVKDSKDVQSNMNLNAAQINAELQNNLKSSDLNIQKNLNQLSSNNNLNKDIKIKQVVDEKPNETDLKIGLNKENLVPLPLAMSNNISEMLKKAVVVKNDVPNIFNKIDNSSLSKESDAKIDSKKLEPIKESKKEMDVKKQEEAVPNKEGEPINLLEVLRTKAEKTPVLNPQTQPNIILHREIRSVDDNTETEDMQLSNEKEQFKKEKELKVPVVEMNKNEVVIKRDTIANQKQKYEDSCDKDGQRFSKNDKIEQDITETPLIKMITRLSNPELVSVKLLDADDLNVDSILKPLKRDLKSYKSRKRK